MARVITRYRTDSCLPVTRLSTSAMNHTCLYSPSRRIVSSVFGTHFPPHWGEEAEWYGLGSYKIPRGMNTWCDRRRTVLWMCEVVWCINVDLLSTQPCIPLGSLNRVPALIGWGKGGNVTSAGWQVTLCNCNPIWHVSSRSGEACCELLYPVTLLTLLLLSSWQQKFTFDYCNASIVARHRLNPVRDVCFNSASWMPTE